MYDEYEYMLEDLNDSESNEVDDYQIEERIGKGQFSEVFRATSKRDGVKVAIKKVFFYDMLDAESRMDCLKEIKLLQQFNHENIIRYLGSFIEDSQLHIVLELADAGDLSRLIRRFRKLKKLINERTIWKYFVQICAALNHMHSKRIMHRDIKPPNVFITMNGIVKLGDLGLGRYFSHKTMAAHSLVGTPYYMSPERIKEHGYSFQSDIWSLGCLLFELAALHSPFYASKLNLYGLIKKIENCEYDPLPSYAYSSEFRNLVDICIKVNPSERPNIIYVYDVAKKMYQKSTSKNVNDDKKKPLNYSKAPG